MCISKAPKNRFLEHIFFGIKGAGFDGYPDNERAAAQFQVQVNQKLSEGFKLQGGVSTGNLNDGRLTFSQAMYR